MSEDKLLKLEEVAMMVGCSGKTINLWYKWRNENPENELAIMLPDYIQNGVRQTRYWHYTDVWKLIQFKNAIPHGRAGLLGDVTQKYMRKRKLRESMQDAVAQPM